MEKLESHCPTIQQWVRKKTEYFFFCVVDSVNNPSTHSFRLCVPGPITIQEIQNTYTSLLFHIAIRCSLEKERTIEKENV